MELNGPLFDGLAAAAAERLAEDIERTVADEGVDMIRTRLGQVLKKPTPHYSTKIETLRRHGGTEVTGESVIYHWWLEGVGSRNFPVTRFRGYHTFQITAPLLSARSGAISDSVIPKYLREMGGVA